MTDQPIRTLLQDIDLKRIGLPEIQREFVWSEQKAKDLIDSLYKKFPVGVILLWRPDKVENFRLLESQDSTSKVPDWLILDGQQRLTSLGQIKDGEIKVLFNIDDESFQIENRGIVTDPHWIRIDEIWTKGTATLAKDLAGKLSLSLDEIYEKYIPKLHKIEEILDYRIPFFEIREDDYARISEMYVRLNEKGTKLRKAEINLALIVLKFPKIFYKKLNMLVEDFEEWELDANFFLRCFVCVATNQSKFEPIKNYLASADQDKVLSNLNKISDGLQSTFNFITSHFGINENNNQQLVPSEIALIPLTMYFINKNEKVSTSEDLDKLILWFFCASHYSRYSVSTESTLNFDLKAVIGDDPVSIWLNTIERERTNLKMRELRGRINRTNLFALHFALRQNNAIDWWSGTKIENTSNIEFHHIFPKKVLRSANYPDNQINDVRNIAIVSRKSNRKISAMKPENYFTSEIGDINRVFSQFVPEDKKYWKVENYLEFLEKREENIISKLNQTIDKLGNSR